MAVFKKKDKSEEIVEEEVVELNEEEIRALERGVEEREEEGVINNSTLQRTIDLVVDTFKIPSEMIVYKFDIKKNTVKIGMYNSDFEIEIKVLDAGAKKLLY